MSPPPDNAPAAKDELLAATLRLDEVLEFLMDVDVVQLKGDLRLISSHLGLTWDDRKRYEARIADRPDVKSVKWKRFWRFGDRVLILGGLSPLSPTGSAALGSPGEEGEPAE